MRPRIGSASNVDMEGHIEELVYIPRKGSKHQKSMIIRLSAFYKVQSQHKQQIAEKACDGCPRHKTPITSLRELSAFVYQKLRILEST